MYAKIINGQLILLPQNYITEDGMTIFNFHLADEAIWIEHGFKPVIESSPPDNINRYEAVYVDAGDNIIIESWCLLPPVVQVESIAAMLFVQAAQSGGIDESAILENGALFPIWNENWRGKAGFIVQDEGNFYRSIHDVTNAAQNTKPSENPSMWTRIGNPDEEYPQWFQPIGAHDAYQVGDKVTHNEKRWVSIVNANIWEPGVYGWEEVV